MIENNQKIISLTSKDFVLQTMRAGGKGGQYQNKTESAVRIIHPESGAIGESREERSQLQNKKIAFKRLTSCDKFRKWLMLEHNRKCGLLPTQKQLEAEVDAQIEKDFADGKIIIEEV